MDRGSICRRLFPGILLIVLAGCQNAAYYGQAAWGHARIMAAKRPIAALLEDPRTPAPLNERLAEVLALRRFAESELKLPVGDSYRSYAELDRPWALWNVFAAPELSLKPVTWCYPVAGCAAYRGYFSEEAARRFAQALAREGRDVYVAGVLAYSTLGWFEDPLLSTFLRLDRTQTAALIFHELAHRLLFVPGDTEFSESFASAVEAEGVRRWAAAQGTPEVRDAHRRRRAIQEAFTQLVLPRRAELEALYAADLPPERKRENKAEILDGLRRDWERMRQSQPGLDAYAGWFAEGRNNAGLASVSAYHGSVPAFDRLLAQAGGDLERFYAECRALAAQPAEERRRRLRLLRATGPAEKSHANAATGAH